ncbi:type II secretion system protein [Pelagicoccus sp. SDUM812005]|uniref:type II secretion system protein n=1 Tax=Pelagicoccus sp. SDUM812005 TaxID=3041257 RepID=UPI00280DF885|nr:type II secretion system protein [Pelagicoccus sp. SDUM812005]MDQ8180217.1 type II secretion system protein [Pelagicoccus sp. SDUM812005]
MSIRSFSKSSRKKGLTIIELIVVVTIIGLMAAIAIPAYTQSRQSSIATRTANDFRKFAEQFNHYALQNGTWPEDGLPTTVPSGMEPYLSDSVWPKETPVGGYWDYDFAAFGFTAGVSIDATTLGDSVLQAIDGLMDDGNLSTGIMIKTDGNRLSYILEQ